MTDVEMLINVARHYCLDNYKFWANKYSIEKSGNNNPYSDNDYNIFSRYNVLEAIRQGVETFVGQEFSSFESCKNKLKLIGENSHSIFTIDGNEEIKLLGESGRNIISTGKKNLIEKKAISEERDKFINYIALLTPDTMPIVQPFPFRRRLKDPELLEVRQRLIETWNYDDGYWEPLYTKSPKETVFLMKDNITQLEYEKLYN